MDEPLLNAVRELCADENLIVVPHLQRFIQSLTSEQRSLLARLYSNHEAELHELALDIEEGRLRDQGLWQVLCVLRELDREGDSRFARARLLGRRRVIASPPHEVEVDWLPENLRPYLPVFQMVIFARANDLDPYKLIPDDQWGLGRPSQEVFDQLEEMCDCFGDAKDANRDGVTLNVSLVLDSFS